MEFKLNQLRAQVLEYESKLQAPSLNADLLNNITPGQQIIKITHEEFTNILGKTNHKILFSEQSPSVILLV